MFGKPTLTNIIKRDLADALSNAHEHSKAAEHHEALMVMFSDRAERLQERLDAEGNQDSKPPGLPSYMLDKRAGGQPSTVDFATFGVRPSAEDFPAVGARP